MSEIHFLAQSPKPKEELINPWCYWTLQTVSSTLEKQISANGPVEGPAGRRVIKVVGVFDRGSSLN